MTFEYMFTHDLIISQGYAPRGRGIIPEKIKKNHHALSPLYQVKSLNLRFQVVYKVADQ